MKIPAEHEDKVKIIIGFICFFIPVLLYAVQIPFYQNCIGLPKWLLIYAGIGAVLGLAFALYLIRDKEEDFQKLQIGIAGPVIGILAIPLLITLINRIPFLQNHNQTEAEVVSIHAFEQSRFGNIDLGAAPDGYYIYCLHQGEVLRLQSASKKELGDIQEGQDLQIIIKTGLLGLRWVELPAMKNGIGI